MLKSELDDILKNPLHQDGDWYILALPDPRIRTMLGYGSDLKRDSVIYHVCSKSLNIGPFTGYRLDEWHDGMPFYFPIYTTEALSHNCGHCHQYVPESVQTLWTIHNFNYLS